MVPFNIFSRGDIFLGGVEIFSGGVVEKFSRGSPVGNPHPPEIYYYFFENQRGTKKTDGG